MLTPLNQYQQDIKNGILEPNEQQSMAVDALQQVFSALTTATNKRHFFKRNNKPVKGLYLWGGVGIGKTYLMDAFFHHLPIDKKMRMHFHRFMKMIQDELKKMQGNKDPLNVIAKNLAKKTRVLCFDEFFVNDIADAMILANLFESLLQTGITLVATSNVKPDDLYHNGLQRNKFLPAIDLIKKHTDVIYLDIKKDYRLRHLIDAGVFFYPNNIDNLNKIEKLLQSIAHTKIRDDKHILIEGRTIDIIKRSTNILWVDFSQLCAAPRSQIDYLQVAKTFSTVILTNVPVIQDRNRITYFINLIDILYDSSVNLIMMSAVPFEQVYSEGDLSFEFRRTKSRLQEMQSENYLAQSHIIVNTDNK